MTEATADIAVSTEVVRRDEINGFVRGRLQVTSTATEAFAAAKDLFFESRVGGLSEKDAHDYSEEPLKGFFDLLEGYGPLKMIFNKIWDKQRDEELWGGKRDIAVVLSETIVQTATAVVGKLAMKEDYPELADIPQEKTRVMVEQIDPLMKYLRKRWPSPSAK